jgi:hypothetical protein
MRPERAKPRIAAHPSRESGEHVSGHLMQYSAAVRDDVRHRSRLEWVTL